MRLKVKQKLANHEVGSVAQGERRGESRLNIIGSGWIRKLGSVSQANELY